jgi:hypothetical protein
MFALCTDIKGMASGLTVIEQPAVHEAVPECVVPSVFSHSFMKTHVRISVKDFLRKYKPTILFF